MVSEIDGSARLHRAGTLYTSQFTEAPAEPG
jgi:hypothetical protein